MAKNIPKWSLRETIQSYDRSHSQKDIFSRYNKVLIFGKAESDIHWHHNTKGKNFFSVTLEVERSDSIDHIPVLLSETLVKKKNLDHSIAGTWLEVAGQFRSYNIIIDGSCQLPLFVFAKTVSQFSKTPSIDKRLGTNAIFLDGCVAEYPIVHFASSQKEMTELVLAVSGGYGNTHLIPCVLYGEYARLAVALKYNDFMSFYGHIQNKVHSAYRYPCLLMSDYNTAYEVAVVDVQSSSMFKRSNP